MELKSMLVLTEKPNTRRTEELSCSFTGMVLFPIGVSIPVILKGKKCVGLGIVSSIHITKDVTKVYYTLNADISDEDAAAYYRLYQNQASTSSSQEDRYENTDAVIPGVMASSRRSHYDIDDERDYGNRRRKSASSWIPDDVLGDYYQR